MVSSCGSEPQPASDDAAVAWRQIDDGWARAVALDPPFVLDGARAGDALDAVVLASGAGELVVESRAGIERVAVEGAARVVVPLAKGGRATIRFEGAAAMLHAPRLVRSGAGGARAGSGSGLAGADPGSAGAPVAPRRILLVVIDTLRADAVTSEIMPELLDAFADGRRFTRAYSAATWTLPAMASLFTGKAPTELALPDGTLVALAPGEPTLATDLAAQGYHGVGISANYTVHHENGFSSGFELFLVRDVLNHGEWPDAQWVLDRARRTLEWFPERDLFLYLHLMDPHDPYRNHESGEVFAAPSTGATAAAGDVEAMRAAYRSEARRVSVLLERFLRDSGPFDRVVVTADHGEEFFEHGGFKHGPTVYPEVSRVPLLVRGDGVAQGTVDAPVSMLGLRRFIAARDGEGDGLDPGGNVDVVSFVHAAPRYAWAHDAGQAVLFGRDLRLGPDQAATGAAATSRAAGSVAAGHEAGAAAPVDAIGEWLGAHHPALDFVDPGGRSRAPVVGEAMNAALRLARRFYGLRAGRWVLVPGGVDAARVELTGVVGGGYWWGAAKSVAIAVDAVGAPLAAGAVGTPVLAVEDAEPFVLAFVPAAGTTNGESPADVEARHAGGAPVEEIAGPPDEAPRDRVLTWRDPGRPAAALEGVEETMRRLRAQGYL